MTFITEERNARTLFLDWSRVRTWRNDWTFIYAWGIKIVPFVAQVKEGQRRPDLTFEHFYKIKYIKEYLPVSCFFAVFGAIFHVSFYERATEARVWQLL